MEVVMSESSTHKDKEENPRFKEAREHLREAHKSLHHSYEKLLPEGFLEHRRAARKEFLLAMRSMLDSAIDHVDKKDEK
jgi:hypothetical protein